MNSKSKDALLLKLRVFSASLKLAKRMQSEPFRAACMAGIRTTVKQYLSNG